MNFPHVYKCIHTIFTADKYSDGAWVPVARTGTVLCPVDNLEKYFLWDMIAIDSDSFLFLQLTKTKRVTD